MAIPRDEIVDPPAPRAGPDFPWYNRDQCRTPMQWTAGPNAGFTTGRPWLRHRPRTPTTRNVAAEAADPDSVLAAYRRLLAFRRTAPALRTGAIGALDAGDADVLAWTPRGDRRAADRAVNFVGEPRTVRHPAG